MEKKELSGPLGQGPGGGDRKKKPHPLVIWALIGAIVFLAVSGLWGGREKKPEEPEPQPSETAADAEAYTARLETRLAETLKKINGAGAVSVFINLDSGGEKILAADWRSSADRETGGAETESSREETQRSVVLTGQGSGQNPYVVQEKVPAPAGILVVAEGAGDLRVRNEIYEAVRALFGLAAHRIKITN